MQNKLMWTTREVLTELHLPYWTLYGAIRAGHLPQPGTRLGSGYVWTAAEVAAAKTYFEGRSGAIPTSGTITS